MRYNNSLNWERSKRNIISDELFFGKGCTLTQNMLGQRNITDILWMVKGSRPRLRVETKSKWNVSENLNQTKGESWGEAIFIFKFPKSQVKIK